MCVWRECNFSPPILPLILIFLTKERNHMHLNIAFFFCFCFCFFKANFGFLIIFSHGKTWMIKMRKKMPQKNLCSISIVHDFSSAMCFIHFWNFLKYFTISFFIIILPAWSKHWLYSLGCGPSHLFRWNVTNSKWFITNATPKTLRPSPDRDLAARPVTSSLLAKGRNCT